MLFFFEILLLFIKLFAAILIQLFLWDNNLIKFLLLIICYIVLYFLLKNIYNPIIYNFPNNYKLLSISNHTYNIFILVLYTGLFTVGIFLLRFFNIERTMNINSYLENLIILINKTSYSGIIINILLFSFLLGLYLTFMLFLGRYYRYQIIKRHLYLSNLNQTELSFYNIFTNCLNKLSISAFYRLVVKITTISYRCCNFKELYKKIINNNRKALLKEYFTENKPYNFAEIFLVSTLNDVKYYIHHLICLVILVYDIIYNNMIIIHVFQILPYIFIYEVWARISKFYSYLHSIKDDILYSLVYHPATYDKQTGTIYTSKGELAMEDFQDIIFNYLFPGLVCKEHKELDKSIYLRRLSKKLIQICSTIISNFYRKLYLSHKKIIGLSMIDYIILFEIILMIKTFTR